MENHELFMQRFATHSIEDQDLIEHAYIIAKDAHRFQTRMTGERCFEHPRGVALILIDELRCDAAYNVCAALLHNTVEDTQYVTVRKLARWFNPRVAGLIEKLTKTGKSDNEYYAGLAEEPRAAVIKGCDRLANLRTLRGCRWGFVRKQVDETRARVLLMLAAAADRTVAYELRLRKLIELIGHELVQLEELLAKQAGPGAAAGLAP